MSQHHQTGSSIANARWADPDYIADKYLYQPEKGDVWIGRNPHCFESAIGYRDERHIIVCAGSGSGKGRSFIVNNLAMYPGSTITYDPKGELPYILAPRRGDGNALCDGMHQNVFVLDPLNRSGVEKKYLGYCDPVSLLDPKDPQLSDVCYRIASALVKKKDSGQGEDWSQRGIAFSSLLIEHIVTSRHIKQENRNVPYLLKLALEGNVEGAKRISKKLQEQAEAHNANLAEGQKPIKPREVDPYEVLIEDMIHNEDAHHTLASAARKLKREMKTIPKYFSHVSGEAAEGLQWARSKSMEQALLGWGDETRRFDPRQLKTNPQGISLFIVMPVDDLDLYEPWIQCLFIVIFAAMRQSKVKPKFPVLTFLDEFSSLGYQEYIATSLDNIRGAGMKLCFIVQNYGTLKNLYGDKMESFFTNSGLELYFGKIGPNATEHVKSELGEAQVVMVARSVNKSETDTETVSDTITFGHTTSAGGSESHSRNEGFSFSNSINWQDSKNFGESEGNSMGRNYGPHVFFEGFKHSNNYGTNINRNQGKTRSKGGGRTKTRTTTEGTSTAKTWQTGTTYSEAKTQSRAKGYQIGGGIAETFHKKPLLETHEINSLLRAIPDSDCDHPAFPGLMLARIAGEDPFFVRRSNYDQDPFFERCFSEDPLHKFMPLRDQPLLGYEYTPDHVVTFAMPRLLHENGFEANSAVRSHQKVGTGDLLFSFHDEKKLKSEVHATISGRVVGIADEEKYERDGSILALKTIRAFDKNDRLNLKKTIFTVPIARIKAAQAETRRKAEAAAQHEEKLRQEVWDRFNADYEEIFHDSKRIPHFGVVVVGPAVIGGLMGGKLAGMLFGEGIAVVGFIAGLIGGAVWGSGKFTAYEDSIKILFEQMKTNFEQIKEQMNYLNEEKQKFMEISNKFKKRKKPIYLKKKKIYVERSKQLDLEISSGIRTETRILNKIKQETKKKWRLW